MNSTEAEIMKIRVPYYAEIVVCVQARRQKDEWSRKACDSVTTQTGSEYSGFSSSVRSKQSCLVLCLALYSSGSPQAQQIADLVTRLSVSHREEEPLTRSLKMHMINVKVLVIHTCIARFQSVSPGFHEAICTL